MTKHVYSKSLELPNKLKELGWRYHSASSDAHQDKVNFLMRLSFPNKDTLYRRIFPSDPIQALLEKFQRSHFLSNFTQGYYAMVLVNDEKKLIAVVTAGTQFDLAHPDCLYNLESDLALSVGALTKANEEAVRACKAVHDLRDSQYSSYEIIHMGHSLGGFWSVLNAARYGEVSISIDNPGVGEFLTPEQKKQMGKNMHVFLAGDDNIVNTVNTHIGQIQRYVLDNPNIPKSIRSGFIATHSLDVAEQAIDPTTNDFYELVPLSRVKQSNLAAYLDAKLNHLPAYVGYGEFEHLMEDLPNPHILPYQAKAGDRQRTLRALAKGVIHSKGSHWSHPFIPPKATACLTPLAPEETTARTEQPVQKAPARQRPSITYRPLPPASNILYASTSVLSNQGNSWQVATVSRPAPLWALSFDSFPQQELYEPHFNPQTESGRHNSELDWEVQTERAVFTHRPVELPYNPEERNKIKFTANSSGISLERGVGGFNVGASVDALSILRALAHLLTTKSTNKETAIQAIDKKYKACVKKNSAKNRHSLRKEIEESQNLFHEDTENLLLFQAMMWDAAQGGRLGKTLLHQKDGSGLAKSHLVKAMQSEYEQYMNEWGEAVRRADYQKLEEVENKYSNLPSDFKTNNKLYHELIKNPTQYDERMLKSFYEQAQTQGHAEYFRYILDLLSKKYPSFSKTANSVLKGFTFDEEQGQWIPRLQPEKMDDGHPLPCSSKTTNVRNFWDEAKRQRYEEFSKWVINRGLHYAVEWSDLSETQKHELHRVFSLNEIAQALCDDWKSSSAWSNLVGIALHSLIDNAVPANNQYKSKAIQVTNFLISGVTAYRLIHEDNLRPRELHLGLLSVLGPRVIEGIGMLLPTGEDRIWNADYLSYSLNYAGSFIYDNRTLLCGIPNDVYRVYQNSDLIIESSIAAKEMLLSSAASLNAQLPQAATVLTHVGTTLAEATSAIVSSVPDQVVAGTTYLAQGASSAAAGVTITHLALTGGGLGAAALCFKIYHRNSNPDYGRYRASCNVHNALVSLSQGKQEDAKHYLDLVFTKTFGEESYDKAFSILLAAGIYTKQMYQHARNIKNSNSSRTGINIYPCIYAMEYAYQNKDMAQFFEHVDELKNEAHFMSAASLGHTEDLRNAVLRARHLTEQYFIQAINESDYNPGMREQALKLSESEAGRAARLYLLEYAKHLNDEQAMFTSLINFDLGPMSDWGRDTDLENTNQLNLCKRALSLAENLFIKAMKENRFTQELLDHAQHLSTKAPNFFLDLYAVQYYKNQGNFDQVFEHMPNLLANPERVMTEREAHYVANREELVDDLVEESFHAAISQKSFSSELEEKAKHHAKQTHKIFAQLYLIEKAHHEQRIEDFLSLQRQWFIAAEERKRNLDPSLEQVKNLEGVHARILELREHCYLNAIHTGLLSQSLYEHAQSIPEEQASSCVQLYLLEYEHSVKDTSAFFSTLNTSFKGEMAPEVAERIVDLTDDLFYGAIRDKKFEKSLYLSAIKHSDARQSHSASCYVSAYCLENEASLAAFVAAQKAFKVACHSLVDLQKDKTHDKTRSIGRIKQALNLSSAFMRGAMMHFDNQIVAARPYWMRLIFNNRMLYSIHPFYTLNSHQVRPGLFFTQHQARNSIKPSLTPSTVKTWEKNALL
jgi:hypothetical protein